MRVFLLATALLVLAPVLAAPAHAGGAYISVNGGMFNPGSDYPDDYETGLAAGLSYVMVNEYAGFEFGLGGYTVSSDLYDEDIKSIGLEMLVHFHKTDSTIQPFIALGLARYRNVFTSGTLEETYTGGGGVLKVGARLYLSPRMFIGAYYKRLTNDVDLNTGTLNLGGDFILGELGIVTF